MGLVEGERERERDKKTKNKLIGGWMIHNYMIDDDNK